MPICFCHTTLHRKTPTLLGKVQWCDWKIFFCSSLSSLTTTISSGVNTSSSSSSSLSEVSEEHLVWVCPHWLTIGKVRTCRGGTKKNGQLQKTYMWCPNDTSIETVHHYRCVQIIMSKIRICRGETKKNWHFQNNLHAMSDLYQHRNSCSGG